MTLSSLSYLLFLPLIFLLHHFSPQRVRWVLLLAASLVFYAALKVPYLLLVLMGVACITYLFGLWLGKSDNENSRLKILWGGIAANLLVLVALKYMPFLSDGLRWVVSAMDSGWSSITVKPLIAIGVSYYIFQAISYLIDIYLEIEEPERHFGYFALYLAFFPKLLQGPIERASDLLPQLRQQYRFDYENVRSGLILFAWGMFKKVVIADRIGPMVNMVYDNVQLYQGGAIILATYLFAIQIYFDFSGYTDMALGSARIFNINLTDNFNNPYFARSAAEFWRRWHISFSRWILDYIFKPLQISLRTWKNYGIAISLLLTFLASGLWHGASWLFVIWGLLHGFYLSASVFYKPWQKKIHEALHLKKSKLLACWQVLLTFNMICFAWIFFRANSISDAGYILQHIVGGKGYLTSIRSYVHMLLAERLDIHILCVALIIVAIRFVYGRFYDRKLSELSVWIRWPVYYFISMFILVCGVFGDKSKFIYFNF